MPPANEERIVDAAIIGGGPCGLALAAGLLQQKRQGKFSVLVIEKETPASLENQDWSRAYSYRIDVRGIRLLKHIGLDGQLFERGVRSEGFKGMKWKPDGSLERKPPMTLGSVGYWIQRPQLISLLQEPVPPENRLQGSVEKIEYGNDNASVHVMMGEKNVLVKATHVFGCDGIHSVVRSSLCDMDSDFQLHNVESVSAGLEYRAALLEPPKDFDPTDAYMTKGKTGDNMTLLPYCGQSGEPRPISTVNFPNYKLFQPKTAEELYQALEEEFPQLDVRNRLPVKAATAWCESEKTVFPTPRWSGKAATVVKGKTVAILVGDSLHCYPPDLGQGVNAGMADVYHVLDVMAAIENKDPSVTESEIASLNAELVKEAESVCRLIPIGFPYQYTLPHSFHKVAFYMGFLTRIALHKLSAKVEKYSRGWIPTLVTAPVIFQIQDDPPKKYSTILRNHHRNTLVIGAALTGLGLMVYSCF